MFEIKAPDNCPSVRDFSSGLLQIPAHSGHTCHWLTVPTAKPVVDFYHQVIDHCAGHTTNTPLSLVDKGV
jgi:hypothetical protein